MSKEVMTIEELSQYLDLATSTIYAKVHHKEIPYVKMGNLLRFPKDLIDEWLNKNIVYPAEEVFDEFAKWYSRHVFKQWLKTKGVKPKEISVKELSELARNSLDDLLDEEYEEE